MAEMAPITVDVVSDVVCPWCFIGQRRLTAALGLAQEVQVEVRWRPYQLDPSIPQGGLDRKEYMIGKFGSSERLEQAHASVIAAAAGDGIDFHMDDIKVSPNTLDAHRLIRWAGASGPDVQGKVVAALFSAYFEQGRDIGDHAELLKIAASSGMDEGIVAALLPAEADRDDVIAEIETASRMGVTGVPCFLLEGRYAVMGAQPADALADAMRQVAGMKARGELPEAG